MTHRLSLSPNRVHICLFFEKLIEDLGNLSCIVVGLRDDVVRVDTVDTCSGDHFRRTAVFAVIVTPKLKIYS